MPLLGSSYTAIATSTITSAANTGDGYIIITSAVVNTFTYSAMGAQLFTVPSDVYSLSVTLFGAEGGKGSASGVGGKGARVTTAISVIPGEKLYFVVGGKGTSAVTSVPSTGGFNGGGDGFIGLGGGGLFCFLFF